MSVFIILEGTEYVGKSSLATAIQARLTRHRDARDGAGLNYHGAVLVGHLGAPKRDPLLECAADIEWYRPQGTTSLLWDRFHWGCPIYGPVYRPEDSRDGLGELGVAGYRWLELFLASRGASVFLVTQSDDVIEARFKEHGDDSYAGGLSAALSIQNRYGEFITKYDPITFTHAVSPADAVDPIHRRESLKLYADGLIELAVHRANGVRQLTKFSSYVGTPRPDVLLLGEKRHLGDESIMQAAFMPIHGYSGAYLMRALPADLWRSVGIANALEENVLELWITLGCPKVVVLGGAANDAVHEALNGKTEWAHVPHPQYARRFRHHLIGEYGDMLQQAITTGVGSYGWN